MAKGKGDTVKMKHWALGLTLGACGLLASCDDFSVWDTLFKRNAVGIRGWTGGDGAIGIHLPGAGDRSLWVFGDSTVSGWNTSTDERVSAGPASSIVFGTTIAVQSPSTASPSSMDFFARTANGAAVPVTRDLKPDTNYSAFFSHGWLGFTQPQGTVLWPSGAECLRCDDTDATNDIVVLGLLEVVPSALDPVDSIIATIANPQADPAAWTVGSKARTSSTGLRDDVGWGLDFLVEGSWIYIYGRVFATSDLVVAAAQFPNLTNPAQWWFKTTSGWQARSSLPNAPTANQLSVVARNAGALGTVDKITRRGITQYVLTHDHPAVDHYLYVRTSSSLDSFPDLSTTTPRLDLLSVDSSLQFVAFWEHLDSSKPCYNATWPLSGVADYRKCGLSYHGIAHPHLSTTDSFGISALNVSYVIPHGLGAPALPHGDYYRPKFAIIPLDNLPAWCGAAGSPCWQGVLNYYNTRSLSSGQTQVFAFDVTAARGTTFTARLVGGSGDPDLYLRWNAEPTTTAYDCRPYTSSWNEDCSGTVPANASSAYVMVRGFSSTSTFVLQTHHRSE
jgi:hypothetical protein